MCYFKLYTIANNLLNFVIKHLMCLQREQFAFLPFIHLIEYIALIKNIIYSFVVKFRKFFITHKYILFFKVFL